ncbi:hypothetical protein [Mobiluncus mulieris]|uniref:hypothetical protein n=1 Tax=Mobiluncus mulieris TaxID=2052 RepID=UPI0020937FA1|nr:hypothetical protein [Mobiluncus mulieris]
MAKTKTVYVCRLAAKNGRSGLGSAARAASGYPGGIGGGWLGFRVHEGSAHRAGEPGQAGFPAQAIATFETQATARIPSGVAEFDRVWRAA